MNKTFTHILTSIVLKIEYRMIVRVCTLPFNINIYVEMNMFYQFHECKMQTHVLK